MTDSQVLVGLTYVLILVYYIATGGEVKAEYFVQGSLYALLQFGLCFMIARANSVGPAGPCAALLCT